MLMGAIIYHLQTRSAACLRSKTHVSCDNVAYLSATFRQGRRHSYRCLRDMWAGSRLGVVEEWIVINIDLRQAARH